MEVLSYQHVFWLLPGLLEITKQSYIEDVFCAHGLTYRSRRAAHGGIQERGFSVASFTDLTFHRKKTLSDPPFFIH